MPRTAPGQFPVRSIALAAILAANGCSKTDAPMTTSAATPSAATPAAARSVWDPDPARAGELSQTATLDKYQLSLPKDYAAQQLAGVPPKGVQVFVWKGPAAGDGKQPVLIASVMTGKAQVAESQKNMRQALVNWSAGMADPSGIKIAKRGTTETGTIAGLAFSRFKWGGTTQDGGPANGMAYGCVDDDRVVLLLPITFERDQLCDKTAKNVIVL